MEETTNHSVAIKVLQDERDELSTLPWWIEVKKLNSRSTTHHCSVQRFELQLTMNIEQRPNIHHELHSRSCNDVMYLICFDIFTSTSRAVSCGLPLISFWTWDFAALTSIPTTGGADGWTIS